MGRGTLPNDDPGPTRVPSPGAGKLATSGRDDQARGDTVTGLGPEAFTDEDRERASEDRGVR